MIAPFGLANGAAYLQMMTADAQQANTIHTQIAADAMKQRAQRWQILADTQTKIFEIVQDVTLEKAKTADKLYKKWDAYIQS